MDKRTVRMKLLTKRQREILTLAANGYTNLQIATRLYISATSVNETLGRIFRSLDASDRAHAVALALKLEEIDPADIRHRAHQIGHAA